jgi:hypothetical protein
VLRDIGRSLPLALNRDLRHEAGPYFREEFSEELPPEIPIDFQRGWQGSTGQSLLAASRWGEWLRWWPAAATAVAIMVSVAGWHWIDRPRVVVLSPRITVEPGLPLTPDLTRDWLVAELALVARQQLAFISVETYAQPAGDQTPGEVGVAASTLQLDLRCREQLCVLGLTLGEEQEMARAQELLFPDAPLDAWGSALATMAGKVLSDL